MTRVLVTLNVPLCKITTAYLLFLKKDNNSDFCDLKKEAMRLTTDSMCGRNTKIVHLSPVHVQRPFNLLRFNFFRDISFY